MVVGRGDEAPFATVRIGVYDEAVGFWQIWLSRTEGTRIRRSLRFYWVRRRRIVDLKAGLVKLWDFKIRMRCVNLLTCMKEKGQWHRREEGGGTGVTTQMSTHCITLCPFVPSHQSPSHHPDIPPNITIFTQIRRRIFTQIKGTLRKVILYFVVEVVPFKEEC